MEARAPVRGPNDVTPPAVTSLRRRAVNILMFSGTAVCAVATVSALFFILGYLLIQGGSSLSLSFFTNLPAPVGESGGGMANAMLGSAKLLVLAALIGVPLGFMAGLYVSEFASPIPAFAVRYATDLLNGVPSIVIGIFAYTIVVLPMKHFSTLAGGIALGIMMIPVTVRGTEEFLRAVPGSLREASLALGAPQWMTIVRVVVPAASRGILTAIMLGLARVAGETAPLLFTALNNRYWSPGWNEPSASLPVMIFTYAIAPYEDWHRQAWAAALVLLGVVLTANIAARLLVRRGAVSTT
jgi:phosphate transport system permease protein